MKLLIGLRIPLHNELIFQNQKLASSNSALNACQYSHSQYPPARWPHAVLPSSIFVLHLQTSREARNPPPTLLKKPSLSLTLEHLKGRSSAIKRCNNKSHSDAASYWDHQPTPCQTPQNDSRAIPSATAALPETRPSLWSELPQLYNTRASQAASVGCLDHRGAFRAHAVRQVLHSWRGEMHAGVVWADGFWTGRHKDLF